MLITLCLGLANWIFRFLILALFTTGRIFLPFSFSYDAKQRKAIADLFEGLTFAAVCNCCKQGVVCYEI